MSRRADAMTFFEATLLFAAAFACGGSATPPPATPASEDPPAAGQYVAGSANGGSGGGCSGDDCEQANATPSPAPDPQATPQPTPDPATNYGTPAAGNCADNGDSCTSDPAVSAAKQDCASTTPNQRACYCAAALTYQCFINHGCYAEAGAATQTTRAVLDNGVATSNQQAAAVGAPCF